LDTPPFHHIAFGAKFTAKLAVVRVKEVEGTYLKFHILWNLGKIPEWREKQGGRGHVIEIQNYFGFEENYELRS